MSSKIIIKKLSTNAYTPSKGSSKSAGYDLYSTCDIIVPQFGTAIIPTDLQVVKFPKNCYGRIAARSGLASKYQIDIGGGVIDRDYKGNIIIILYNHSDKNYKVTKGDRIAQLICEKIYYLKLKIIGEKKITLVK